MHVGTLQHNVLLHVQVMREWTVARQHVQKLKASDPRGAARLDKDITAVSFKFVQLLILHH